MRILITGCAGYIGSSLVPHLLNEGHTVIGVDSLMYNQGPFLPFSFLNPHTFKFYQLDATDYNNPLFIKLIKEVDVVIPLAAIVGAPSVQKNPEKSNRINYKAIQKLVDIMDDHQLLVNCCTNSAYGTCQGVCDENSPLTPLSGYAKQKQDAENVAMKRSKTIGFRLATVFGPSYRMRLDLLINTLVYQAIFDKRIELFDGHYRRNYIAVKDICRAISHTIDKHYLMCGQIYNLGNDKINSTKANLVAEIAKMIPCEVVEVNQTDLDLRDYEISSSKLYKTGYFPTTDIQYGIEQLIDYYNRLPNNKEEREKLTKYMRNV